MTESNLNRRTLLVLAAAAASFLILSGLAFGDAGGPLAAPPADEPAPPRIVDVDIAPSKFTRACQVVTLTARATDPNGDDVAYAWAVVPAAGAALGADGARVRFAADRAGDYTVRVTTRDDGGRSASLAIPLHVTGPAGACDPAALVGDED